jgi:nucleoside-diphosphate-sugar epimerase
MKIFVAGASGAIGKQLVPRLVARGHQVVGMTRSQSNEGALRELGATPAVADALDADQVGSVVANAEPDVIIHELTSISTFDMRHFDRAFAETNRLRTEGTDNLLAAGRAVEVKRFIAQSFTSWPYARTGGPVKSEDDPLDPTPAKEMLQSLEAIRHVEDAVTGAGWTTGIVLRYGGLYGPGTSLVRGGEQYEMLHKRKFPVVGTGGGVWSFIHVADAADATVAAVDHGERGIYNIVDDDPAPVAVWLPELAKSIGAPKPWHVPRWVGQLLAGEAGAVMMTDIRGASNAKAKQALGWEPQHASWRDGFAAL